MQRLRILVHLMLAAPCATAAAYGQSARHLSEPDRIRLAEAFRLADRSRAAVWPGWERTPMVVLLVGDSVEYLIGHPRPTPEFSPVGRDPVLGREILVRPRRFPPTLLATFPAVGGISTIVVGSAKRTGKSSGEWVLSLLHEHFHQWQAGLPDYYSRANGLGLARGDTTGQWMLDYPFPYDSAPVRQAFEALAGSLAAEASDIAGKLERLRELLSADDRRYLELQLWQEGVARFVEYEVAAKAGAPDEGFGRLPDYVPYPQLAARLRRRLRGQLEDLDLREDRRVAFYAVGAALASLLERGDAGWKKRYEEKLFALPPLSP